MNSGQIIRERKAIISEENMTRRVGIFALCLLVLCAQIGLLLPARAQAAPLIRLIMDGNDLKTDVAPVMRSGRVLVPIRVISEALGAEVTWNPDDSSVTINGARVVRLVAGKRQATVDGTVVNLDVPAQFVGGRTMVPVRFVSEAFDAVVSWDEARYAVIMSSPVVVLGTPAWQKDSQGRDELSLPADRPLRFTTSTLGSPDRFIVDIAGAKITDGSLPAANVSGVGAVTFSTISQNPMVTRVVMELTTPAVTPVVLPAAGGRGLVVAVRYSILGVSQMMQGGKETYTLNTAGSQNIAVSAIGPTTKQPELKGAISATNVNVRQGPGTDTDVVKLVKGPGDPVHVIGFTPGWYQVRFDDGVEGWVADWLVAVEIRLTRTNINVREGPGTDYPAKGMVTVGNVVTILEHKNGWYKMQYGSLSGYIADWLAPMEESLKAEPINAPLLAQGVEIRFPALKAPDSSLVWPAGQVVAKSSFMADSGGTSLRLDFAEPAPHQVIVGESGIKIIVGSELGDVSVRQTERGGSRIEIKLDTASGYQVFQLPTESALVVRVPHSYLPSPVTIDQPTDLVKQIKAEQVGGMVEVRIQLDQFLGYKVTSPDITDTISVEVSPASLKGKLIVVDAGHGGIDPGAMGHQYAQNEADYNWDIAERLRAKLEQAGAQVMYTQTGGITIYAPDRAAKANAANADLLMAIHINSYTNSAMNGLETLYYPEPEKRRLATLTQQAILRYLGRKDRGLVPTTSIIVTRDTQMPSALAELGFISNPEEETLMHGEDYREKASQALFDAIEAFFEGATTLP
jgi:N-acetylmuramoyl-L-alanine amidase